MEKLSVSEIKFLNSHFGNGYFFSKSTMKFFGDKVSDFKTELNAEGKTVLIHKKRNTKWIFNPSTNELDCYKEVK